MGLRYKRKTTRGAYGDEALKKALEDLSTGVAVKEVARRYGIAPKTLRNHRDKRVRRPGVVRLGRFESDLDTVAEEELVTVIKTMEKALFGLTAIDIRKLAFDLAETCKISHRFNKNSRMAGEEWFRKFMLRHSDLSIRVPEPTSIARAVGFNFPQVMKFFTQLETLIGECEATSVKVWNADETGISTVQKPVKIIATKGSRSVGRITSNERGQTITAMCCMNAAGTFLPPMFIYPRKRMMESLLNGAPPSSVASCSPNGWTDGSCFLKWLQHFVAIVKPSREDKHILILDGHQSHKTYDAVQFARANGIEMLTLPPHCTHRMQPLDTAFFRSLKALYNRAADDWLTSNKGRRITMFEVAGIFATAYAKAATVEKALSGFSSSGIWPFNSSKFTEEDFVAANLTDEPLPSVDASFNQSCTEPGIYS